MKKTLAQIAQIVKGEVVGDKGLVITGLSGVQEAKEGELTFVANSKYVPLAQTTKASAVIVSREMKIPGKSVIRTDNPSRAFAQIASVMLEEGVYRPKGIHPTAIIAPDAAIGKNVAIGPYTVVESQARVADDTVIYSGCYVGHHTTIGNNCLVYPNVTIRERLTIGNGVIIHSGTVLGSDGFGFVQLDGIHEKIPQLGTVIVEDDVEIGANVAIDRARFDKTVIGKGTKIDNLVQVAHNVMMGERCIIVSQVGISGSVKIGNGAVLAGQAGIAGHLTIGEGAIVCAQSGVTKSVQARTQVSGYPSRPHDEAKRINAYVQRLPRYIKAIQESEKRIEELERKLNHVRETKNDTKRI
jgi:UDP-3-O-[3-hydroxymyristoyl] glucosamine N-acyltransferase